MLGKTVGAVTAGPSGECGMLCQIGELGAGIGGNSVLMKFSRGYERDADLKGARAWLLTAEESGTVLAAIKNASRLQSQVALRAQYIALQRLFDGRSSIKC